MQALHAQQEKQAQSKEALTKMETLHSKEEQHVKELQGQLAAVQQQAKLKEALEQRLEQMAKEGEEKRQTIAELEQSRQAQAQQSDEMAARLLELEQQLKASQQECSSLEERLARSLEVAAAHEARLAKLQQQLEERMRWIESLETSHAMHRQRIDELWAEVQNLCRAEPWEASEAAEVGRAAVEAQREAMAKRLEALTQERASLLAQLSSGGGAGSSAAGGGGGGGGASLSAAEGGGEGGGEWEERLAAKTQECEALQRRAEEAEGQLSTLKQKLRAARQRAQGGEVPGGPKEAGGTELKAQLAELEQQALPAPPRTAPPRPAPPRPAATACSPCPATRPLAFAPHPPAVCLRRDAEPDAQGDGQVAQERDSHQGHPECPAAAQGGGRRAGAPARAALGPGLSARAEAVPGQYDAGAKWRVRSKMVSAVYFIESSQTDFSHA